MTKRRLSQSEVIGFDEFEGCLRVRLRTGSIRVLDENGQPVVVSDPLIRKHLFLEHSKAASKPSQIEEMWDPWRQGP
jgi:hypothetical protein